MRARWWLALGRGACFVVVIGLAACGGGGQPSAPNPVPSAPAPGLAPRPPDTRGPDASAFPHERRPDSSSPAGARPPTFPGPRGATVARVVEVTDGDTLVLSGIGPTRLIGVDTPEVFGGEECFGREASKFAGEVLRPGRRMSYRLGTDPRDRYGRALAYVWLGDGRLFNGLLVERGYAVSLTIAPNDELAARFRAAARRARARSKGLWSACGGDPDRPLTGSARVQGRRGPDRDCADFETSTAAQRYFNRAGGGPGRNVDDLDADGDGRVCESLP